MTRSLVFAGLLFGLFFATDAAPFRIEGRAGSWTLLSPEGAPTFMRAVDHVKYDGFPCWKTGRNAYRDANDKDFPDRNSWETNTVERLRRWGFNMLGCGSDASLAAKGLCHADSLDLVYPYCRDVGKGDEGWLCPNKDCPGSAFPNVFDHRYADWCRQQVRKRAEKLKDDPTLFGYFIDNELNWTGGRGKYGLFDVALAKPTGHSARKAVEAFLVEQGTSGEGFAVLSDERKLSLRRAFVRLVARRFFEITTAAIREVDPSHLVLGVRFAGLGAAPEILQECGRLCDVVTVNCYPWVDLDQERAYESCNLYGRPVMDVLRNVSEMAGRPLMVTEWAFSALDAGLPCTKGSGQRFRTQAERTKAARVFAREMLRAPFVVGYSYFMWVDEPAQGMHPAFLENTNYGLVNERGEAYPITEMFAELHADQESVRRSLSNPDWKPDASGGGVLTDGETAFRSKPGQPAMVQVARNGVDCSYLTVQLKVETASGAVRWPEVTSVTSVAQIGGTLEVTGEIKRDGFDAEVVARLTPSAVEGNWRFELVRVLNRSSQKMTVRLFLLKAYPSFKPTEPTSVPNLWERRRQATWTASDGRTVSAWSASPFVTFFTFQVFADGSVHPDLMFAPRGGVLAIEGGATYDAGGGVSICGAVADAADESFFGVDSACSWLSRPGFFRTPNGETDLHRYTVEGVADTGFPHARERLSWNEVNPKPGVWDFSHYLKVYSLYREKGVRVSGMFHDCPKWMESRGGLPTDLKAVYEFAKRLGETFGDLAEDWEFWNEEDIGFCEASAWDYVAAAKAAYLGFKDARPASPALMGALCKPSRSAYDACLFDNDLGLYTDAMNFHTYSPRTEQPRIFVELRDFLKRYGLGDRAIWVTESGTHEEGLCEKDGVMPGQGAHSPEQELRQASIAAESQMLMMMAGVSRDYFFVFPPYNEMGGKKDWGMMRRDGTLKPVAAMFKEMIRRIGKAQLLGEAAEGYVFRQPDGSITLCTVGKGLPTYRDNVTDCKLVRAAAKRGVLGAKPAADDEDRRVVLQVKFDDAAFPLGGGKSSVEFTGKSDRLTVVAFNLDGVAKKGRITVAGGSVSGLPESLELPAWGKVSFDCTYRPEESNAIERLVFSGRFNGKRISRLTSPVSNPQAIWRTCRALPIDLADSSRWLRNDSATSYETSYDATNAVRRFHYIWKDNVDRWVYPKYRLSPHELENAVMLEFEIRSEQDKVENDFATQNVMLFRADGSSRHIGFSSPLGAWEKRRIDLSSEKGLELIETLSIGLNPVGRDLTFYLRNVRIWKP